MSTLSRIASGVLIISALVLLVIAFFKLIDSILGGFLAGLLIALAVFLIYRYGF